MEESTDNGDYGNDEEEGARDAIKVGIDSIFAKKKVKKKDAEEESDVTAILDIFGNGQVKVTEKSVSKSIMLNCSDNLSFFL